MQIISCRKKTKDRNGKIGKLIYVSGAGKNMKFTPRQGQAFIFYSMAHCKHVRDDLLGHYNDVTVLKV